MRVIVSQCRTRQIAFGENSTLSFSTKTIRNADGFLLEIIASEPNKSDGILIADYRDEQQAFRVWEGLTTWLCAEKNSVGYSALEMPRGLVATSEYRAARDKVLSGGGCHRKILGSVTTYCNEHGEYFHEERLDDEGIIRFWSSEDISVRYCDTSPVKKVFVPYPESQGDAK
ncbi:MAG: hypothetical protein FWC70_10825 [Defluviitaleaceae bacterium]|nr:hypothetical protein [Defluviitaleaceae bacterium]